MDEPTSAPTARLSLAMGEVAAGAVRLPCKREAFPLNAGCKESMDGRADISPNGATVASHG